MTVAAAVVLLGTTVTIKAASLLRVTDVSISQNNDNSLILKHANELFGNSDIVNDRSLVSWLSWLSWLTQFTQFP